MAGPTALPVIAERWPTYLLPSSCDFGPSRNDLSQTSPVSRTESVIRRGRRLWAAKLTWTAAETNMADLRLWLEALQGYQGSVILWDFTSPWPSNPIARDYPQTTPQIAAQADITFTSNGNPFHWSSDGAEYNWRAGSFQSNGGFVLQGAMSVALSALPPSQSKLMKAGEYIQLNRRLYLLAQDLDTDEFGLGTAQLMTPTLEPLTNGMPVYIKEAGCEMRLFPDQDWTNTRDAGDPSHTVSASFLETTRNFAAGGVAFAA